jgi:hypothetical protein
MTHAYFAVIDRFGLRALKPETPPAARSASVLRHRLEAAVCWVVVPDDVASLLRDLLDSAEFGTAFVLLMAAAEHYGPVLSELNDLASRRGALAA